MPTLDDSILKQLGYNPEDPNLSLGPRKLDDNILQQLEMDQAPVDVNLQAGGRLNRAGIKTFMAERPDIQLAFYKRQGFNARLSEKGDEVEIYVPEKNKWGVPDPHDADPQDIIDVVGDLIEMGVGTVATALGTTAGGAAGLAAGGPIGAFLGASAGAGAGAAGSTAIMETAKQKVARRMAKSDKPLDIEEIKTKSKRSGGLGIIFGAAGKVISSLSGQDPTKAAVLLQGHSAGNVERLGRTRLRNIADFTKQELGTRNVVGRSSKELEEMLIPRVNQLGAEIKASIKKLDDIVPPIQGEEAVQSEINRVTQKAFSKDALPGRNEVKLVKDTINNFWGDKTALNSSDKWELIHKLETQAKTFSSTEQTGNAKIISTAARNLRSELIEAAKTNGIKLKETSSKYWKLLEAQDAYAGVDKATYVGTAKASGPFPMGLQGASQTSKRGRVLIPEGYGVGTATQATGSILDIIEESKRKKIRESEYRNGSISAPR